MEIDPRVVLNEARNAYKEENYSIALSKYQWFYKNSIEINKSFYGVRLSYCLNEWAELGEKYQPAKEALVKLKETTLSSFNETLSQEAFHEYSCICEYLGCSNESYEEFIPVHKENKNLATKLFTYVYEYCASNNQWELCKKYLGNGHNQYKNTLEIFDHMIEFSKKRTSKQRESMSSEAVETIKRESVWLLNMLSHTNSLKEYDSFISRLEIDLKERDFENVYKEIYETVQINTTSN